LPCFNLTLRGKLCHVLYVSSVKKIKNKTWAKRQHPSLQCIHTDAVYEYLERLKQTPDGCRVKTGKSWPNICGKIKLCKH
jgi:hypothetical protein